MALAVEETDTEGRAIFFQSNADISKAASFNVSEIDTMEKINHLFDQKKIQAPKSRCYIYAYASFLTICAAGIKKKHKVQQKITYDEVQSLQPCENDPNVIFMLIKHSKSKIQLRVLRLPSSEKATKMRFVIDQIQLNPFHICGKNSMEENVSKRSSDSENDGSFTSASHPGRIDKSIINNDLELNWQSVLGYNMPQLPRVQPYQSEGWDPPSPQRIPPYRSEGRIHISPLRERTNYPRGPPQTSETDTKTNMSENRLYRNDLTSSDYRIYRPKLIATPRTSMDVREVRGNMRNAHSSQKISRYPLSEGSDSTLGWEEEDELQLKSRRTRDQRDLSYRYEEPPTFCLDDFDGQQRSMSAGRRRYRKY